jgi:hypothetical protein
MITTANSVNASVPKHPGLGRGAGVGAVFDSAMRRKQLRTETAIAPSFAKSETRPRAVKRSVCPRIHAGHEMDTDIQRQVSAVEDR